MCQEKQIKNKPHFINGLIAFLLILATVSACSAGFRLFSQKEDNIHSSSEELEGVITGISNIDYSVAEGVKIFSTPDVINTVKHNEDLQLINSGSGSVLSIRANHNESTSTFAFIKLANMDESRAYSNYRYLTIDFDVSAYDGYSPLGCSMFLQSRDNPNNNGSAYNSSATTLYIRADGENIKVETNSGSSSQSKKNVHVTYVFEFDSRNITKSKLQILFDGVVKYDSTIEGEKVFSTLNATYMGGIRIDHFSESGGSTAFKDLKVTGYRWGDINGFKE